MNNLNQAIQHVSGIYVAPAPSSIVANLNEKAASKKMPTYTRI